MDIETRMVPLDSIAVPPERLRALRTDIVEQLAQSIGEQGQLQPVLIRPDGSADRYTLIAGRHRLEACRALGHEAIRAEIRDGVSSDEAELAEIDENLVRADLSPAERAAHTHRRVEIYARSHGSPKAKGAHAAHAKMGHRHDANAKLAVAFTTETATRTRHSTRTVQRDARRGASLAEAGVLADVIGTSLDKGEEIDALAKLPAEEQRKLATRAKTGEKVSAKQHVKKVQRAQREQQLAHKQLAMPEIKFNVMVEDLEWDFEVWSRETGMDRHAANHYPVADKAHTAEELHRRTTDRFACAANDCVLLMWATVPMLRVALDLMALRGFRYVSHYTWGKDKAGTGYWSRNKHELLLIGVKGNIPAPAVGTQWESLIMAPVGRHSAKPAVFMEMIEQYYPHLPKIELNCRGKPRPGWHGWGLEVDEAAE